MALQKNDVGGLRKSRPWRCCLKATRPLLEALKFAVGGSRCLALRRELKLADQGLAGAWTAKHTDM
eukprot:5368224-Amphidinium_carterae.1